MIISGTYFFLSCSISYDLHENSHSQLRRAKPDSCKTHSHFNHMKQPLKCWWTSISKDFQSLKPQKRKGWQDVKRWLWKSDGKFALQFHPNQLPQGAFRECNTEPVPLLICNRGELPGRTNANIDLSSNPKLMWQSCTCVGPTRKLLSVTDEKWGRLCIVTQP